MVFKFSKSETAEIFRILFLLSHLVWKELQNYSIEHGFICHNKFATLFEPFWIHLFLIVFGLVRTLI